MYCIYIYNSQCFSVDQSACFACSQQIHHKLNVNESQGIIYSPYPQTNPSFITPNPPKDKVNQLEKYSLVTCEIDSAFGYHLFPLFIVKNDILLRSLPLFTIHKRHINPNCYLKFAFVVFLHIIVLYIQIYIIFSVHQQ